MRARDLARIWARAYERGVRLTLSASRRSAEEALRLVGLEESPPEPARAPAETVAAEREQARQSLRERGAELLRRSADVNLEDEAHPAYIRILEDMAPDEARIMRLLYEDGPQPSVDIRSGVIPLQSSTELVAGGLNMVGQEAGARHLGDVPAYLNNLFRLGLIWFSRERLPDPKAYQLLEAQPEVSEALASASHTRTVRRSINLTPFGRDFCELCLTSPEAESAGQPGEPDTGEPGDGAG
jgi:hypothetical protein